MVGVSWHGGHRDGGGRGMDAVCAVRSAVAAIAVTRDCVIDRGSRFKGCSRRR